MLLISEDLLILAEHSYIYIQIGNTLSDFIHPENEPRICIIRPMDVCFFLNTAKIRKHTHTRTSRISLHSAFIWTKCAVLKHPSATANPRLSGHLAKRWVVDCLICPGQYTGRQTHTRVFVQQLFHAIWSCARAIDPRKICNKISAWFAVYIFQRATDLWALLTLLFFFSMINATTCVTFA